LWPGVGLVCGAVSGHLEMLELEGRAVHEGVGTELNRRIEEAGLGPLLDRILRGYMESTPSDGIHTLMRVVGGAAAPSMKLAQRNSTAEELAANPDQPLQTLIETKGEGGFTITAPSNGTTHPTGGSWTLSAGGFATIATVTVAERDALYDVCRQLDAVERTEDGIAKVPPKGRAPRSQPYTGGPVGESYMDVVVAHLNATDSMADALLRYGWVDLHKLDRDRCPLYERPGQTEHGRNGALINANGRLVVFSTSTPFFSTLTKDRKTKRGSTYDLLDVYAAYEHEGDRMAAARAIATETGILTTWQAEENARELKINVPPPGVDRETRKVRGGGLSNLPPEFWTARPVFGHIRRAAIARELLPGTLRTDLVDGRPLGSGEGVAEAFYGTVTVPPASGKGRPTIERKIVNTAALIYVDEGEAISQIGERRSSTLLPELRAGWSGQTIGQGNASADTTRIVPAGKYRLVLVVNWQPELAAGVLGKSVGGFPQRLVWFSALDASIPPPCDREPWPGTLA
jgi:hypothetical protein